MVRSRSLNEIRRLERPRSGYTVLTHGGGYSVKTVRKLVRSGWPHPCRRHADQSNADRVPLLGVSCARVLFDQFISLRNGFSRISGLTAVFTAILFNPSSAFDTITRVTVYVKRAVFKRHERLVPDPTEVTARKRTFWRHADLPRTRSDDSTIQTHRWKT